MPQDAMNLNGQVDVPQGSSPLVHFEFNGGDVAIEQASCLLGLFCLRLMSNLNGRAEAAAIANSLRAPVTTFEDSTAGSLERHGAASGSPRTFEFQCAFRPMTQPQFTLKAKGFGLLAMGVGEAAIGACDALRRRVGRSFRDDLGAIAFLNEFCRCIGDDYLRSNVSLSNHAAVVANAIIQSKRVVIKSDQRKPVPSTEQPAGYGTSRVTQYQVADATMERFDRHRQQFMESVGLSTPSQHQATALCALQVHTMMTVMGHWQYMLQATEDCKEICHHIIHRGCSSPESCVALLQAMGEQEYDVIRAEQFIGNEFFIGKGVEPENQRVLSAAFLRFRFETLLATAEVAGDDRVAALIRTDKQRADVFLSERGL